MLKGNQIKTLLKAAATTANVDRKNVLMMP